MDFDDLHATYYKRRVGFHAKGRTEALLIGIAPGPQEALNGLPMIASQGSTLYRLLRKAKVSWAMDFEEFSWPIKMLQEMRTDDPTNLKKFYYLGSSPQFRERLEIRQRFMDERAKHIAVSNAVPYWPLPTNWSGKPFAAPHEKDVLADSNLRRLKRELKKSSPEVLFLGGYEALMLACGYKRAHVEKDKWSTRVGERLKGKCLQDALKRLNPFKSNIVYLGHPNRWNFGANTEKVLQELTRLS